MAACVKVRQSSRGFSAMISCAQVLVKFRGSWKTQSDVSGRYWSKKKIFGCQYLPLVFSVAQLDVEPTTYQIRQH